MVNPMLIMEKLTELKNKINSELANKWVIGLILTVMLSFGIYGIWYWSTDSQRKQDQLSDEMTKIETSIMLKVTAQNPDISLDQQTALGQSVLAYNSDYTNMKNKYKELVKNTASPVYLMVLGLLILSVSSIILLVLTLLIRYFYTKYKFDSPGDAMEFYKTTWGILMKIFALTFFALLYYYKP